MMKTLREIELEYELARLRKNYDNLMYHIKADPRMFNIVQLTEYGEEVLPFVKTAIVDKAPPPTMTLYKVAQASAERSDVNSYTGYPGMQMRFDFLTADRSKFGAAMYINDVELISSEARFQILDSCIETMKYQFVEDFYDKYPKAI